jgi:hypothetical protein
MSWIFAICTPKLEQHYNNFEFPTPPIYTVSIPGFYLAIGGMPETSFFENNLETSTGWSVVGTGIILNGSHARIMTFEDWKNILQRNEFDATKFDGHFVLLRWTKNKIDCFTDQLGLRTAYFATYDDGVCISTRLDWIARKTKHNEIDFASLGSRWLMFNQISYDSCVSGISRVGPNGHVVFHNGSVIKCTSRQWLPSFEKNSISEAEKILISLIKCALEQQYTPSLGLSGGFDSRLLLAMFSNEQNARFVTHTFGNQSDPDVRIARIITKSLGIEQHILDDPLPDVKSCVSLIRSFVAQTLMVEPVSSIVKLRYYPELRKRGRLMIDGGFGEIARRQYLNRVVRLGRPAIRLRNSGRLMQLMRFTRADIFCEDVLNEMKLGAHQSLEKAIDEMPPVEKIGVENFVDLFAIRTRIPNYGGPEQARLDGEILNFMPLVQPSFLRSIFKIPVSTRANGKFYSDIIGRLNPELKQFPLVKSGITYPFGLSSNIAWLITKVKSRMINGYSDPGPDLILAHIREYVLDIVNSKAVKENPIYDFPKIIKASDMYYRGVIGHRHTLDWWLTFEIWKSSFRV